MRILVSGVGRSGTCLLTEVVRGLDMVNFSERLEDRRFFKYKDMPENYGTKFATDQRGFSMGNFMKVMDQYENLHLIFSLRHPIDIFLSKIWRGQKPSDGGDGSREQVSADGTVETAIIAISDFYSKYVFALSHYSEKTYSVKLEDLIHRPEMYVRNIANFFQTNPTERAFKFYEYDRNRYHQERYKKQLDSSQVGLHKRWDTIYDGFFKDRKHDIEHARTMLYFVIKGLGYDN